MRSHAGFLVPPYSEELYPYRSFPPWKSAMRVCSLLASVTARRTRQTHFKFLEVALVQASQRIVAVALGDLPPGRWYRRARVAVDRLERAKLAVVDYVAAGELDLSEAQAFVDAIDVTITELVDEVARVPLPEEIRARLPDLSTSLRLAH
jgi:hypothetical protein